MVTENFVEIVDNVVNSKIKYESNYNSFVELLFEVLIKDENKIVLVDNDSGRNWTSNELLDGIVSLGVKFAEIGISKGDVVAFFCPNSDLHAIALLSIWAIGAVYTGLIHQSPLRELNNVLVKTNSTYLVGSKETIHVCNEFLSSNKTIKKFFVIDKCTETNVCSINSMIRRKVESNEKEAFSELMSAVKPIDLCTIAFSSGTTGEPKAVMVKQSRYISYIRYSRPDIGIWTERDACALIPPLPHVGGTQGVSVTLLCEARLVVFSKFSCEHFVDDVQKHGITLACIVNAYINLLNKSLRDPLESFSLKKVITGGEFSQKIVCDEFIEKFKTQYFAQAYGSTEAGLVTFMPFSQGITNVKSIGIPTPGNQIKIVDLKTGDILGANKIGEICIKGPEVIDGYLNNEKATLDSFDEQSFFKSGDVGYFDEEGHFYIIDRIKEVIKYNTQQVSPTELQNLLLQHVAVKEAAVVGIPNEVHGQLPKAFVVLKQEFVNKVDANELLQFVNSQVMDFKKLRGGLIFMSELPKSSLGKIDTKVLKIIK